MPYWCPDISNATKRLSDFALEESGLVLIVDNPAGASSAIGHFIGGGLHKDTDY